MVVRSHQVEGWEGFELADWARAELGIAAVAVQNDADTAGLGEARFGSGVGLSPVFYVTIGSGIGGGLILDGQIYRGAGSGAAEIGHLWVDDGAGPGSRLEDIASGWSIGAAGRVRIPGAPDSPDGDRAIDVARAAEEGDPHASAILDRATDASGEAWAMWSPPGRPRRIILGGGVSLIDESLWLGPIRAKLDARAFPPFRGTYDLAVAALWVKRSWSTGQSPWPSRHRELTPQS